MPYAEDYGNNFGRPVGCGNAPFGWAPGRATLRIARREAWRHKGRSLLVILMIAIPVLGLTATDVLFRSMQLTPIERLDRSIGAAEAGLILTSQPFHGQALDPVSARSGFGVLAPGAPVPPGTSKYDAELRRVRALLPAGTTFAREDMVSGVNRAVANRRVVDAADVTELPLANPITRGIQQVVSGRAPAAIGEVAANQPLVDALHLHLGQRMTLAGRSLAVTGIVRDPDNTNNPAAVVPPGTFPDQIDPQSSTLLADTHGVPVGWSTVSRLNAVGVLVSSRAVVADPPATGLQSLPVNTVDHSRQIGIGIVAVGLAILEVVLLAGAAFAVGARRQTRDLALIAASGADERQVGAVVLANGIVLGGVGALAGLALGVVAGRLALPEIEHLAGRLAGGFHLRPLELAAIVVIGLVTGLLAAVLPARSARRIDVVAALTGRRRATVTPKSVPITGLAMAAVGGVMSAYAARPPARFGFVLVGLVIGELGFVICAPAIVGLAARLARRCPLPVRLALRDAERHRGRTGPAVAAIIAAVAGITATAVYAASQDHAERDAYQPAARIGQTVIDFSHPAASPQRQVAAALPILRRELGATGLSPIALAGSTVCRGCGTALVTGHRIPSPGNGPQYLCDGVCQQLAGFNTVAVGDATTLRQLLGRADASAEQALATTGAVALARTDQPARDVRLTVQLQSPRPSRVPQARAVTARLIGIGTTQGAAAAMLLSPVTAARLGYQPLFERYLVDLPRIPSADAEHRADAAILHAHLHTSLDTERGWDPTHNNVEMLALLVGALIVVLGTTGVVTGLSAAESKPDLATLAAVGAAPRTRRALVAGQAGTIALLGTLTGVVSGAISAFAILGTYGDSIPFTIPWPTIAEMALGLPLLAGLLIGALTRARLPVERRWV